MNYALLNAVTYRTKWGAYRPIGAVKGVVEGYYRMRVNDKLANGDHPEPLQRILDRFIFTDVIMRRIE